MLLQLVSCLQCRRCPHYFLPALDLLRAKPQHVLDQSARLAWALVRQLILNARALDTLWRRRWKGVAAFQRQNVICLSGSALMCIITSEHWKIMCISCSLRADIALNMQWAIVIPSLSCQRDALMKPSVVIIPFSAPFYKRAVAFLSRLVENLSNREAHWLRLTLASRDLYSMCSSSASKYSSVPVIERVPGTTIPGAINRPKAMNEAFSKQKSRLSHSRIFVRLF